MNWLTKSDILRELKADGLKPSDITLARWITKFGVKPMNVCTHPRRYPRDEVNKMRKALGLDDRDHTPSRNSSGLVTMEQLRKARKKGGAR